MNRKQHIAKKTIILVVDDDPVILELVQDVLAPLGYQVIQAANGHQAILMGKKEAAVDILMTDIMMPGMTGLDLVSSFMKIHPQVKILYMSGYMGPAVSPEKEGCCKVGFLPKPIIPRILKMKVKHLLA